MLGASIFTQEEEVEKGASRISERKSLGSKSRTLWLKPEAKGDFNYNRILEIEEGRETFNRESTNSQEEVMANNSDMVNLNVLSISARTKAYITYEELNDELPDDVVSVRDH